MSGTERILIVDLGLFIWKGTLEFFWFSKNKFYFSVQVVEDTEELQPKN